MDDYQGESVIDLADKEYQARQPRIDPCDLRETLCRNVDILLDSVVELYDDMNWLDSSMEQERKLEYKIFFQELDFVLTGILKATSIIRDYPENSDFLRVLNNAAVNITQYFDALTRIHIVATHFFVISQHFKSKKSITLPPDPTLQYTVQSLDRVWQTLLTITMLSRIPSKQRKNETAEPEKSFPASYDGSCDETVLDISQYDAKNEPKESNISSMEEALYKLASALGSVLPADENPSRRAAAQNQDSSDPETTSDNTHDKAKRTNEETSESPDSNPFEAAATKRPEAASSSNNPSRGRSVPDVLSVPAGPEKEAQKSPVAQLKEDQQGVPQSPEISDEPQVDHSTDYAPFSFEVSDDELEDSHSTSNVTKSGISSRGMPSFGVPSSAPDDFMDITPAMEDELAAARRNPHIVFSVARSQYESGKYHEALIQFEEAKRLGSTKADYYIGLCYFNGLGVSKDLGKAFKAFFDGASLEDPRAMYELAVCFEFGFGVLWNTTIAIELYTKAIDLGSLDANIHMAMFYLYGFNVESNFEYAAKLLSNVIDAKFIPGMMQDLISVKASAQAYAIVIGDMGTHVAKGDFPYTLKELVKELCSVALELEAERLENGFYGKKEPSKAARMYKLLAEKDGSGSWQSAWHSPRYGLCLMQGVGMVKNSTLGRKLITDAIGTTVLDGVFTEKENVSMKMEAITDQEGTKFYDPDHPQIAATDSNAWFVRGKCYREGIESFEHDPLRARQCFLKAASAFFGVRGVKEAHVALGEMYMNGEGGSIDAEFAIHHFLKAGCLGDLESRHKVALLYAQGRVVRKNMPFAIQELRKLLKLNFRKCRKDYDACLKTYLNEAKEDRRNERTARRKELLRETCELTPIVKLTKWRVLKNLVADAKRIICKHVTEIIFNDFKLDSEEGDGYSLPTHTSELVGVPQRLPSYTSGSFGASQWPPPYMSGSFGIPQRPPSYLTRFLAEEGGADLARFPSSENLRTESRSADERLESPEGKYYPDSEDDEQFVSSFEQDFKEMERHEIYAKLEESGGEARSEVFGDSVSATIAPVRTDPAKGAPLLEHGSSSRMGTAEESTTSCDGTLKRIDRTEVEVPFEDETVARIDATKATPSREDEVAWPASSASSILDSLQVKLGQLSLDPKPSVNESTLNTNPISRSLSTGDMALPAGDNSFLEILDSSLQIELSDSHLPPSELTTNEKFGKGRVESLIEGKPPALQKAIIDHEMKALGDIVSREHDSSNSDGFDQRFSQSYFGIGFDEEEQEQELELTFDNLHTMIEMQLEKKKATFQMWIRSESHMLRAKRLEESEKELFPDLGVRGFDDYGMNEYMLCSSDTDDSEDDEEETYEMFRRIDALSLEEADSYLCNIASTLGN